VVLRQLTKFYGSFLAVDHLTVGIPKGECFGLLGVNGAGKTTTFSMLTGQTTISSGDAFLDGASVAMGAAGARNDLVGYCPQFDALIDQMTARETLWVYARLRGIYAADIDRVVEKLIRQLTLENYADRQAGKLSGGNKRKLNVGVALVGNPSIIFLDEPTTGVDPAARRQLWNTLVQVRDSGRTLILTSHSMEECEALCTRMAVMVNGRFQCLRRNQHLKTKFGEGYSLVVKLRVGRGEQQGAVEAKTRALMQFVSSTFPSAQLKDQHHGLVQYQIARAPGLTWARLFGRVERSRTKYDIEDYSVTVSQTTLEQLFISFARMQREPPKIKHTSFIAKCC